MRNLILLIMSMSSLMFGPLEAWSQTSTPSDDNQSTRLEYLKSRIDSLAKMENDLNVLQMQLEYSDLKLSNAVAGGVVMYGFVIPEVIIPTIKTLARSAREARKAGGANEIHKTNYVLGSITLTIVTLLTARVTYSIYVEAQKYNQLLTQIRLMREKIANEVTILRNLAASV